MALKKICPMCGTIMSYDSEDCNNKCKEKRNKLRNQQYDLYNRIRKVQRYINLNSGES